MASSLLTEPPGPGPRPNTLARGLKPGEFGPDKGEVGENDLSTTERLERIFSLLLAHVRRNPALAREIEAALATAAPSRPAPAPPPRAPAPVVQPKPAVLDPFEVYDTGWESMLRERLQPLDVDQLKAVVHQFKLDPTGKMSGKSATELRDAIIEVVIHRQGTD
jgi:hypothetical protein